MCRSLLAFSSLILGLLQSPIASAESGSTVSRATTQPKEWTFLIFLNGNNNLDSFGALNINQMEKIGSNARINIVVQWASLETRTVKRLLVKKDNDTSKVTSPVIENMGQVDMGDWKSLVDFVRWGSQKFPAERYFVDVWNHGSGWHDKKGGIGDPSPMDISFDDLSGNHMTTKQLALALQESAKIIGHKIDLYASDACLMAMIEIANEMKDSVSVFAGSEEVEPGAGWPYDAFLARWNELADASPQNVAKTLSQEYAKSYQGTSNAVTFSVFDLSHLPALNTSIRRFNQSFQALSASASRQVLQIASRSQNFTNSDYVDFIDFIDNLKASQISSLDTGALSDMRAAAKAVIIANDTVRFPKAHGMAIWIPTSAYQYQQYSDLYSRLLFDQETRWGDVLKKIVR
ncbi:MAG: hypothetical protein KGP28_06000 [Bdellovibrionales bacterium]|nr:hypothetical protein [Bdellovibrionales bacterium]